MSSMVERLKRNAYQNKSQRNEVFSELMEMQVTLFFTQNCSIEQLQELRNNPEASILFMDFVEKENFPFNGILEKMGFQLIYEPSSETENEEELYRLKLALDPDPNWSDSRAKFWLNYAITNSGEAYQIAETKRLELLAMLWEVLRVRLVMNDNVKIEHDYFKDKETKIESWTLKATVFFTELRQAYSMDFLGYYSWAESSYLYFYNEAQKLGFDSIEWSSNEPCKLVLIAQETFSKT